MKDIKIECGKIEDIDYIFNVIEEIERKKESISKYIDIEEAYSKDRLKSILNKEVKEEVILIAKSINDDRILGIINLKFQKPDYIFFVDKFVYVKYMYLDADIIEADKKFISEELFKETIKISKKYGFKYLCSDVLEGEKEVKKILEDNRLRKYRNRLCKKICD